MGPYDTLPEPVRLEDTIAESDTKDAPDPEGGRDTNRDWLVRYGVGGIL